MRERLFNSKTPFFCPPSKREGLPQVERLVARELRHLDISSHKGRREPWACHRHPDDGAKDHRRYPCGGESAPVHPVTQSLLNDVPHRNDQLPVRPGRPVLNRFHESIKHGPRGGTARQCLCVCRSLVISATRDADCIPSGRSLEEVGGGSPRALRPAAAALGVTRRRRERVGKIEDGA